MITNSVIIHKLIGRSLYSFCTLSLLMHSMACATTAQNGSTLPAPADIETLVQKTAQTTDAFMKESLEARLVYECSGKFLSRTQQQKLHSMAQTSSEQLETIINSQKLLKKQIEDYEGDDWDSRYGESGFWRNLEANLQRTIFLKCEVDYFRALSATEEEKKLGLYDILDKIASLSEACRVTDCALLKARIFIALSPDNNKYKQLAENLLNLLLTEAGLDEKIYFKAAVAKNKLAGQSSSDQLEELIVKLAGSSCRDEFELNLSVAFLQRRFGSVRGLERIAQKWPEARAFMGKIVLQSLQSHHPEQLSVIEAKLVAQAAWQSGPAQYAKLLNAMAGRPELQIPLVLYVTALAQVDSSPARAIKMLMRASQIQQAQKSDEFSMPAVKIAAQAAELAYQLFAREPNYCESARRAIADYITLTGSEPEQRIEYLYGIVLNKCGRTGEDRELLRKIADGKGKYHYKAGYELIAFAAREQRDNEPEHRADLIRQLNDLIAALEPVPGEQADEFDREVRNDAKILCCQLLVAQGDKASCEQALSILAELERRPQAEARRLTSQALQCTGRLKEALKVLIGAVDTNDHTDALQELGLLLKITEKIDEYKLQMEDFDSFVGECCNLAEHCVKCVSGSVRPKAAIALAELSIFAAGEQEQKLLEVDKQLAGIVGTVDEQDADLLRCRARLLRALGKYDEAGALWSQICQMRKAATPWETSPSKLWWRAKFYQLDCQSRTSSSYREEILHGLEVLEPSFGEIPEPWAEKLSALKKSLEQGDLEGMGSNSLASQGQFD